MIRRMKAPGRVLSAAGWTLGILALCACGEGAPLPDEVGAAPEGVSEEVASPVEAMRPECLNYIYTTDCLIASPTTSRCTDGSTLYKVTYYDLMFYENGRERGSAYYTAYSCGRVESHSYCNTVCGIYE